MSVGTARRTGLLVFLAASICLGQTDERVFKVYGIMGPDPEPIAEAVRAIVGDTGKVIFDTRRSQLLVMALPDQHKQIRGLLAAADRRGPNIRVAIRTNETADRNEEGLPIELPCARCMKRGAASLIMGPSLAVGTEPDPPEDQNPLRFAHGGTSSVSSVLLQEAIMRTAGRGSRTVDTAISPA